MMKKFLFLLVLFLGGVGVFFIVKNSQTSLTNIVVNKNSPGIRVVAAENFYGDVVKQLGGTHVVVTSILSNPNVDPHEYELNVQDGVAISQASIVIKNGLDYDSWIDKLIAASPNNKRIVLIAGNIATHKLENNPHVWYGIDNMQDIAKAITNTLKTIDPSDSADFDTNLVTFLHSLQPIGQTLTTLKSTYAGTPVGLTETIFLYQTQSMDLNVLTPIEFQKAIAEGNDPAASVVKIANDQVQQKLIKALIYNSQTITPITTNLLHEAKQQNIPLIPVSETMPQGKTYQSWMSDQLQLVQQGLAQGIQ